MNESKQTILIADDHPAFRTGVRQYFRSRKDFELIGEVGDGQVCFHRLETMQPDWAVIDLSMPSMTGFQILQSAREQRMPTRIIVMSMFADQVYAERAKELGARGFIAKEDAVAELDQALRTPEGQFFMSESVGRSTNFLCLQLGDNRLDQLTPAESRILRLLAEGATSKEIGRELNISPRTVQSHRRNIADKLELHGHNKLLEFAVRNRDQLIERD